MASIINLATAQSAFAAAGLLDADVFEVLRFGSVGEPQAFLFPEHVGSLSDEAFEHLYLMISGAASRASLARRVDYSGADGRLGDALWAAKAGWRRAREVELAAAAAPAQAASSQTAAGASTS